MKQTSYHKIDRFIWICSNGHYGNTNKDDECKICKEPIKCKTAGGHFGIPCERCGRK